MEKPFADLDGNSNFDLNDLFTALRNVVYISLACFVIIIEGQNPELDVYTDVEIGLIVCSSFGAVLLEKFISLKWK